MESGLWDVLDFSSFYVINANVKENDLQNLVLSLIEDRLESTLISGVF